MDFLDKTRLAALDAQAFRHSRPFRWINPAGLLRAKADERLRVAPMEVV